MEGLMLGTLYLAPTQPWLPHLSRQLLHGVPKNKILA